MTALRGRLPALLAGFGLACHLVAVVVFAVDWHVTHVRDVALWREAAYLGSVVATALVTVAGATVAGHQRANRVGWLLLATGVLAGAYQAADAYVWAGEAVDPFGALYDSRYPLPGRAYAGWIAGIATAGFAGVFRIAVLLYPYGDLPGRRWRWVAWVTGVVAALAVIARAVAPGPVASSVYATPNPFAHNAFEFLALRLEVGGDAVPLVRLASAGTLVVCAIGAGIRLRRLDRAGRAPVRAFAGAVGVVAAVAVVDLVRYAFGHRSPGAEQVQEVVTGLALLGLALAAVDGVFRHRLFDIEIAIRRTTVFGVTSAFVLALYLAASSGTGSFVLARNAGWALPLAATGIAAVGLQPVVSLAEKVSGRLIFGSRPHARALLARAATDVSARELVVDVLPTLARALASATGSHTAIATLGHPDDPLRRVVWGDESVAGHRLAVPVMFVGEEVGRLELVRRFAEPWTDRDEMTVSWVAGQAGPAFHNVLVIEELQRRVEETAARAEAIAESRRRLASAQLAARAGFEESIRIRVQPLLDEVEALLRAGDLRGSQRRAEVALTEVRRIAHGLHPSELRDLGIVAALASEARERGVALVLDADADGRWEPSTEAAVYSCLAAAIRAAPGTTAQIHLIERAGVVTFEASSAAKIGDLARLDLIDRIEAAAGTLSIEIRGSRLHLDGRVPVTDADVVRTGDA